MKELNRTPTFYEQMFDHWLTVPSLNMFERSIVNELKKVSHDLAKLDVQRRFIVGAFPKELAAAITKGRLYGVGQEEQQYA